MQTYATARSMQRFSIKDFKGSLQRYHYSVYVSCDLRYTRGLIQGETTTSNVAPESGLGVGNDFKPPMLLVFRQPMSCSLSHACILQSYTMQQHS